MGSVVQTEQKLNRISRIFVFQAFLLPPIAVYAPKGMVVIAVLAAAALLFEGQVRAAVFSRSQPLMMWAFLPLMAWALVSILWSPDPLKSVRIWGGVMMLLALARVLCAGARLIPEEDRKSLISAVALGGLVFVALVGLENFSDGFVIKFLKGDRGRGGDDYKAWLNPGNAILVVFAWTVVMAVARRKNVFFGVATLGLILVVVASGPMKSAVLALVVSALLFSAFQFQKRLMIYLLALALVIGALVLPFVIEQLLASDELREALLDGNVSTVHRWRMWEFVVSRIFERPVLGWGLDSSRAIPGGHELAFHQYGELLPLHPHNAFLQIWLELGLIGILALCVVLAAAPFAITGIYEDSPMASAMLAVFTSYVVLGQLSFGVWQSWWLATGIVSMACLLAVNPWRQSSGDTGDSV